MKSHEEILKNAIAALRVEIEHLNVKWQEHSKLVDTPWHSLNMISERRLALQWALSLLEDE